MPRSVYRSISSVSDPESYLIKSPHHQNNGARTHHKPKPKMEVVTLEESWGLQGFLQLIIEQLYLAL